MYSKDFVVAVIYNGKFCDEDKSGVITLPFGAEYTIRLRNKNSRRAVAKVFIDEENVSGGGIIVSAHNYTDLERSVNKAVKFKFVSSQSGEAIDQGKNNRTDGSNGVIRVEWKLEREKQVYVRPLYQDEWTKGPWKKSLPESIVRSTRTSGVCGQSMSCNAAPMGFAPATSEGCTVEGGYSNQSFRSESIDLESSSPVVIRLVLRGYQQEELVELLPITKKFCADCGMRASGTARFCSKCGSKL